MRTVFSLIAAFALTLTASSAHAQQFCAARDKVVAQIEKQFKEKVSGRGLAAQGKQLIELFVSQTGSWTMLVSDPQGRSCVMASGEDWQGLAVLVGDSA